MAHHSRDYNRHDQHSHDEVPAGSIAVWLHFDTSSEELRQSVLALEGIYFECRHDAEWAAEHGWSFQVYVDPLLRGDVEEWLAVQHVGYLRSLRESRTAAQERYRLRQNRGNSLHFADCLH